MAGRPSGADVATGNSTSVIFLSQSTRICTARASLTSLASAPSVSGRARLAALPAFPALPAALPAGSGFTLATIVATGLPSRTNSRAAVGWTKKPTSAMAPRDATARRASMTIPPRLLSKDRQSGPVAVGAGPGPLWHGGPRRATRRAQSVGEHHRGANLPAAATPLATREAAPVGQQNCDFPRRGHRFAFFPVLLTLRVRKSRHAKRDE